LQDESDQIPIHPSEWKSIHRSCLTMRWRWPC